VRLMIWQRARQHAVPRMTFRSLDQHGGLLNSTSLDND
jgi:hypothetical protein